MFHLPALCRIPVLKERLVLVDRNAGRAQALARKFDIQRHATDHRSVLSEVKGALVLVPPRFHHAVAMDCLRAGVAVLCEKPLAQNVREVQELAEAAERTGVPIAVNNTHRLWPAGRKVNELLKAGAIGKPKSLTFRWGEKFDWPAASGSYFGAAAGGRGVLFDVGAHAIDQVCWWLGGTPALVDYEDDADGGTEADAHVVLEKDGCRADVRLSWLTRFPDNGFRIEGETGSLEGGIYNWKTLTQADRSGRRITVKAGDKPAEWGGFADILVQNFVAAVQGNAAPIVSGRDVVPGITLIDACYARRRRVPQAWNAPTVTVGADRSRTVLVTGAGGFIGGRVVELLHETGFANVRAGVRRWSSAARLGRLPVEIVQADVTDPEQARKAVQGAWAVIHCAVGSARVTVEGTRAIMTAASEAGVRRIVHLSTVDVYGQSTGSLDETKPYVMTGREYGDSKIEAEKVCREAIAKGAPIALLRPTLVHGPFSATWTVEFAERLQVQPWRLPESDCQGTCNLVYVDDLVEAIKLALTVEAAKGEAFNINGPERPTWNEYFRSLNSALSLPPLVVQGAAASHVTTSLMNPVRKSAKLAIKRFEPQIMGLYQRSDAARKLMKFAEKLIRRTPTSAEFDLYSRVVSFEAGKADAGAGISTRTSPGPIAAAHGRLAAPAAHRSPWGRALTGPSTLG